MLFPFVQAYMVTYFTTAVIYECKKFITMAKEEARRRERKCYDRKATKETGGK
jgi:hypothetical protein